MRELVKGLFAYLTFSLTVLIIIVFYAKIFKFLIINVSYVRTIVTLVFFPLLVSLAFPRFLMAVKGCESIFFFDQTLVMWEKNCGRK
jgi:hypothetical protein